MRCGHLVQTLALFSLLSVGLMSHELTAQEEEAPLTDFRTRSSYTAEELGAALFPLAAPSTSIRTRGVGVAVRPPQAPPVGVFKKASVAIPVLFETNSAAILPQYYADLDKLGAQLTAPHYMEQRVQIEGHTDNRGTVRYNQMLSEKRAQSVQQYLIQRFGIVPDRLPVKGYGPSRPIAPNTSEEGRWHNRRIEIANFVR
jgi:outer membrane protein OmpA-like peptidoglycan-associated protein